MISPNRRQFLSLLGGSVAAAAVSPSILAAPRSQDSFEFLFVTDTHLQPELNAAKGCDMAFRKGRTMKAEFAIQGGDHVFDAMDVSKERALALFDQYDKTEQDLAMKVYHTCGNHDCFGIGSKGAVAEGDKEYGKRMYEERFGRAYYSFDHKGVHFVVLDSVQPQPGGNGYLAQIDEAQIAWLKVDLDKTAAGTPVIVTTHVPLVTAFESYEPAREGNFSARGALSVINSDAVIRQFEEHNVIGVLQGHTHIWETVVWRGVPYITGGAVSGNWWKGVRMGTPEGFAVARVENGKLYTRYEAYGFKAVVAAS